MNRPLTKTIICICIFIPALMLMACTPDGSLWLRRDDLSYRDIMVGQTTASELLAIQGQTDQTTEQMLGDVSYRIYYYGKNEFWTRLDGTQSVEQVCLRENQAEPIAGISLGDSLQTVLELFAQQPTTVEAINGEVLNTAASEIGNNDCRLLVATMADGNILHTLYFTTENFSPVLIISFSEVGVVDSIIISSLPENAHSCG